MAYSRNQQDQQTSVLNLNLSLEIEFSYFFYPAPYTVVQKLRENGKIIVYYLPIRFYRDSLPLLFFKSFRVAFLQ